ncbi:transporter substrate-binding domain-containing protein [Micromonospora sp. WMMD1102]|uniref:transporter substrate-binding domain-containing protein n=1 Tax=Micromonospora sp. WMMD1102 TaxID=3016105 RepID=UPI002414D22B|nr:transporter substrate-binding domain-containing protein [Micromonospora sp. WMMD1102]MDG4791275.1 transporter substrate-binding domain-containing protein [Micromonospora sp. WMMD1102]
MTERSPSGRVRLLGTTLAVVLTLLLAAGAGCDSQRGPEPPSVQEKLKQSHIYGQSKLRIGVATFEPLMGVREENGEYRGFDIDIARYIAASLGYAGDERIEFVHLATEDRIPALQSGQVDIVVSSFSITEERQKLVSFAGPYFVTTQEVMIPVALKNQVRTIEDLRTPGFRVCVGGGSTTEAELEKHEVKTLVVKNVRDCVQGMIDNKYDAVSSDETILAGFRSSYPTRFEIVDMPFGTSEQLGVGVPISDPALRDLVAFFLQKSYLEGRAGRTSPWLSAYHRNLGPWLGPDRQQPPPLNVPDLVDFDEKAPV